METSNPYQTPEGDLSIASHEYGNIRLLSPGCRIGRLRYWSRALLATLVSYAFIVPLAMLAALYSEFAIPLMLLLGVGYIAMVTVFFIFAIQRLHDLNQSGWLCLLTLVPVVNLLFAIYIMFWPGTRATNNFGNIPPSNQWWHWACGLALPFIAVAGILAAIAMPAYQDYVVRAEQAMQTQP